VLVHQALVYRQTELAPEDLDRLVFGGYVAGLRTAGTDVPVGTVRLGYVLTAALWCGLMDAAIIARQAFDPGWPARSASYNRRPFDEILVRRARLGRFLVDLVDREGLA
jgi:hypothetical protein